MYLASNTYDGANLGFLVDPAQNNGSNLPSYQSLTLHEPNNGLSVIYRGNPTQANRYGTVTNTATSMSYTSSFALTSVTGPNGATQSVV